MSNATLTQPIAKLYKRCSWGKHAECPGSFQSWSVCSCGCHAEPICEMSAAGAAAVIEAQAIVTAPKRVTVPQVAPIAGMTPLGVSPKSERTPKASKPKDDQRTRTGLPGPNLPRNVAGGLKVSITYGFGKGPIPVVKVTEGTSLKLRPEQRFPESVLRTSADALKEHNERMNKRQRIAR
jgi:hypothetical protein